jgi:nicotinate-nucleotide adenylyltransferase
VICLRLGIYGGTFNPPHLGHVSACKAAISSLQLDKLLIVPSGLPPHKELPPDSPSAQERMDMVRLSFSGVDCAEIADLELKKESVSYTADTVATLRGLYPGAELFLVIGTDMFLTLEGWKDAEKLLQRVTPAVLLRAEGERVKIEGYARRISEKFGTNTVLIDHDIVEISSSWLREALPKREGFSYIDEAAYAYIIKQRLYGARPSFAWLRKQAYAMMKPKRIPHVEGCESEAVRLAEKWGADVEKAREAAILHDITKHLELSEQLLLCGKYDIMTDSVERSEVKLLHAKTGAALARDQFGVSDDVYNAILWHTTGRPAMTLLEKIIYIADYIEPTRDFDGLGELRRLAYKNIDKAVVKGLNMSIEDMRARGIVPHLRTEEAAAALSAGRPAGKGDMKHEIIRQ